MTPRSWLAVVASVAVAVVLGGCDERPGVGSEYAPRSLIADWTGPEGQPAFRNAGRSLEVRSDRGPEHCDWQSVVFLDIAWPLGTTWESGEGGDTDDIRTYVRDPEGALEDGDYDLAGQLNLDAGLPADSRATGYEMPSAELWFGPDGGDRYAYLVRDNGTVERWPRAEEEILCE